MGVRIVSSVAWDLEGHQFHNGVTYKTHALARELPEHAQVKVIFVFGSASEAASSVWLCRERYGTEWVASHLEHLRASGTIEDLRQRDVLRFEDQIDGWLSVRNVPVLGLHYDHLWSYQSVISKFVGFPVHLPPRRPRTSTLQTSQVPTTEIQSVFSTLDKKIAVLPRCVVPK
ncbi:MAG: hypothetical protein KFB96_24680 [Thiocapsa sp.]|uniref:hypothetical protein n=1 Tax=Thiocapsa sp. TaxID=2024551 RepID=UPI001BCEA9FC|nr:hypothetical protein [Thiocapsa sp.]QVL48714.1 MAG: hypothetical protein KFB96_24680 [Thiocapsa sp.]